MLETLYVGKQRERGVSVQRGTFRIAVMSNRNLLTFIIAENSKVRIHEKQIGSRPSRQRSDFTSCQKAQNHFHFVPAHHHNVPVSGTYYEPFMFPFPMCATMTFTKHTKTALGYRRPVIFSRHCSHSSLSVF